MPPCWFAQTLENIFIEPNKPFSKAGTRWRRSPAGRVLQLSDYDRAKRRRDRRGHAETAAGEQFGHASDGEISSGRRLRAGRYLGAVRRPRLPNRGIHLSRGTLGACIQDYQAHAKYPRLILLGLCSLKTAVFSAVTVLALAGLFA